MKYLLIIAYMLVGEVNVFSQIQDTSLRVKIITLNPNLVLPELYDTVDYCTVFPQLWQGYLNKHPDVKEKLHIGNDSVSYYGAIYFTILKSGSVSNIYISRNNPPLIDQVVKAVYEEAIRKMKWKPSYLKRKNGRSYLSVDVSGHFSITDRHVEQVVFSTNTYGPIYSCGD